jgi:hypothetical protein
MGFRYVPRFDLDKHINHRSATLVPGARYVCFRDSHLDTMVPALQSPHLTNCYGADLHRAGHCSPVESLAVTPYGPQQKTAAGALRGRPLRAVVSNRAERYCRSDQF